ncbi:hypothetical protein Hanom_Chr02g00128411 [Helianthus anomalus]
MRLVAVVGVSPKKTQRVSGKGVCLSGVLFENITEIGGGGVEWERRRKLDSWLLSVSFPFCFVCVCV